MNDGSHHLKKICYDTSRSSWIKLTCFFFLGILLLKLTIRFSHFITLGDPILIDSRLLCDPVLIAYVFIAWYFLIKLSFENVIRSLKRWTDDRAFRQITESAPSNHNRLSWYFTLAGGLIGMLCYGLPKYLRGDDAITVVLDSLVNFILFAVLGCILFMVFIAARRVTKLVQQTNITNILDPTPFRPVAKWSLAVSLSIIGGIVINLIFLNDEWLGINTIFYIVFLIFAAMVFFIGMWSTHQIMLENKQREINKTSEKLVALHGEALLCVEKRQLKQADILLDICSKLRAHQHMLERVSEWPFTSDNIGSLVFSISAPVLISLLKSLIL